MHTFFVLFLYTTCSVPPRAGVVETEFRAARPPPCVGVPAADRGVCFFARSAFYL